ncbi:MAG: AAA family ATPase [Deferribacteraceae bacterium]|jgi:predicted ATPase|nr:AAA family ATPase [Deferribacteraceae bacterium]
MPVNNIEIEYPRVFKGEFRADFRPGMNLFIGGNATVKTTLLRCLYDLKYEILNDEGGCIAQIRDDYYSLLRDGADIPSDLDIELQAEWGSAEITIDMDEEVDPGLFRSLSFVYIPKKDILEHARGLLTFIEQKQTGFSRIYKDILIAAMDVPTNEQSATQKSIGQKIAAIIGGNIRWDKGEGSFYPLRTDGIRIPFANEASGYKKFSLLGLLAASGQLKSGSVLFWDEPENSLNPELLPVLADILLELSRNGVQIFIATHSEILASCFAVNRQKGDETSVYSLYRDGEQIKVDRNNRFDFLKPNNLVTEPVRLYEKQIERGLGSNG